MIKQPGLWPFVDYAFAMDPGLGPVLGKCVGLWPGRALMKDFAASDFLKKATDS